MIRAQSADGKIHEFPDGTSQDVVDRVMRDYAKGGGKSGRLSSLVAGDPNVRRGAMGEVLGGAMNLYDSIPFMNEGAAALDSAYRLASGQAKSVPEAWKQSRKLQDANAGDFAKRRPLVTNALKTAGAGSMMFVPTGLAASVMANGSLAGNALRGATLAAGMGYAYGLSDKGTLAERAQNANALAADPVNLAIGAVGGALATPARGSEAEEGEVPAAPSLEEMKAAAGKAYDAVDEAGVRYAPQATERLATDMTADAASKNINPRRHPKATSILEEDVKALAGTAPTMTELDQLRQVIRRDVANAADDAEAYFGNRMIRVIDNFINGATPQDVMAGDPEAAAELMKRARDLAQRGYKAEEVLGAVDHARLRAGSTGAGGNIDNATRQEIRKVYEGRDNWTPDEKQLLESIVVGDSGQNFLRQLGKFSPQGNGLMQALNMGAAVATHGWSTLLAAGGAGAKMAADKATQGKVRELVNLIASGGSREELQALENSLAQIAANDPAAAELRRRVAAKIAMLAGAGSAVAQPAAAQPDEAALAR